MTALDRLGVFGNGLIGVAVDPAAHNLVADDLPLTTADRAQRMLWAWQSLGAGGQVCIGFEHRELRLRDRGQDLDNLLSQVRIALQRRVSGFRLCYRVLISVMAASIRLSVAGSDELLLERFK